MKLSSIPKRIKYVRKHNRVLKNIQDELDNKNYLDSISYCNELIDIYLDNFYAYYYKAINSIELNLFEDATEYFEIALKNIDQLFFKSTIDNYSRLIGLRKSFIKYKQRNPST